MPPKRDQKKIDDRPGLVIEHGEDTHIIHIEDLTAIDARDFRHATGIRLSTVFERSDVYDIDVAAGLIWLHRRKREPGLTYEAVATTVTVVNSPQLSQAKPGEADVEEQLPEG